MSETARQLKMYEHTIRAMLYKNSGGMTVSQLVTVTGASQGMVTRILNDVYGFYIHHWITTTKIAAANWRVVPVPENALRPGVLS